MATAGKPSPIEAQGHTGSPVNVPPLKREEGGVATNQERLLATPPRR
jgi:hypothetical protein